MASRLSDLMYRAMNALLACQIEAVRARRAAALAQTPRRAQTRLRAMYGARPREPAALPESAASQRGAPAGLAPAGVAVLLALVVFVTLALTAPPPV